MDFSNLSALTTPELHSIPSPNSYHDSTFSHPYTTNSQHTTSPSTSNASYTPPSTTATAPAPAPKKGSGGARKKRARDDEDEDEDEEVALKRHRNTLAARKYRQKRLDRIKELEDALEEANRERDDLRIRLARQEAETEALKTMMKIREGK